MLTKIASNSATLRNAFVGASQRGFHFGRCLCGDTIQIEERRKRVMEKCAVPEVAYLPDMCAIKPDTPQPCVLIIGAGLAGLSAANRLLQCGISNFRILEATDKAGGRVRSCWFGDGIAELGAELIHGAHVTNNIFTLAVQEQLLKPPLKRVGCASCIFLTKDGRPISQDVVEKAKTRFEALHADAVGLAKGLPLSVRTSLGEYMETKMEDILKSLPSEERYDALQVMFGLMGRMRERLGANIYRMNPHAFGTLREIPGGSVRIPLGLSGIIAPLLRDLPSTSLIYCKPVRTIRWGATGGSGTPRAVVKCHDETEYSADYVIITVPLGVLKNNCDVLFCPALPASKKEAICNLGFGHITKMFLKFKGPFWGGDSVDISTALLPEDLKKKEGALENGIVRAAPVVGSQQVFCVTMVGDAARDMEEATGSDAVDCVVDKVGRALGNRGLPTPTAMMRSSWSSDIFTGGAVTYLEVDSNAGHIRDLAHPLPGLCDDVPPILFFAGEHTSSRYYATMHGARESGIREADRIVELTNKLNGLPIKPPLIRVCS